MHSGRKQLKQQRDNTPPPKKTTTKKQQQTNKLESTPNPPLDVISAERLPVTWTSQISLSFHRPWTAGLNAVSDKDDLQRLARFQQAMILRCSQPDHCRSCHTCAVKPSCHTYANEFPRVTGSKLQNTCSGIVQRSETSEVQANSKHWFTTSFL